MLGRDADLAEAACAGSWRSIRTVEASKHEYVDLRYPNGFAVRVPDLKS